MTKETSDKNGTETSSAKYEYDTNKIDTELTDKRIKSITTESNNETTVKKYTDGVVTKQDVGKIVDGKGEKVSYEYKYHANGEKKEVTEKDKNGKTTEITEYNESGEMTSKKVNITSYLKSKFPELTDYQIKTLIRRCKDSSGNGFNENSFINYDVNNSSLDINIPEFTKDGYHLEF